MSLPDQIRRAIAAGDFTGAARAFEELTRTSIQSGRVDRAGLSEAHGLLAMALAAEAHLQDRLDELRARTYVAGAYTAITPRE